MISINWNLSHLSVQEADNSHLHRCEEIEHWAKDVYDWCSHHYGGENIIGFQFHLDEAEQQAKSIIYMDDPVKQEQYKQMVLKH